MIYSILIVVAAVIVAIIFLGLINNDFHHEEKVVTSPDNIFIPQNPSIIELNSDVDKKVEVTSEERKSFTIGEIVSAGEKPTKIPKKPKDWRKKKLKEDVTLNLE